jgi:hypothetical protein
MNPGHQAPGSYLAGSRRGSLCSGITKRFLFSAMYAFFYIHASERVSFVFMKIFKSADDRSDKRKLVLEGQIFIAMVRGLQASCMFF